MYNKIKNPVTGRFVNTKGIVGKNVLKNYVYQTQAGGGWFDWVPGMGGTEREEDTEVVNENAELINNTITDFETKIREWRSMNNVNPHSETFETIRIVEIGNLRDNIQALKSKHNKLRGRRGKQDDNEQKVRILQENGEECKVKLSEMKERHVEELEATQGECSGIDESLRGQQQRASKWETESKTKISEIKSEISDMVTALEEAENNLHKVAGIDSVAKSEQYRQPRDSQGRWETDDMGHGL
jgi:hypothetical protein